MISALDRAEGCQRDQEFKWIGTDSFVYDIHRRLPCLHLDFVPGRLKGPAEGLVPAGLVIDSELKLNS